MSVVAAGTNWEVKEGLISAFDAGFAGGQALVLIGSESSCIEQIDPINKSWSEQEMEVFRVDAERLASESDLGMAQLLEVYAKTEGIAHNNLGEFFLNLYKPFGSTARHRDTYEIGGKSARSTVAIGLIGLGEIDIEDPETGEEATIVLKPGDALHLNNDVAELERPLHVVRNKLHLPRIAIVNG